MVAINMEIPSCCVTYTSKNDNYTACPFYKICEQRETIKTNYKPTDCPLVEIEERKVGKWIFSEGTKGKDNVEKCSCCGSHWKEAIIYRTDTKEYLRTRLLYCPNCGAEMRGAENE